MNGYRVVLTHDPQDFFEGAIDVIAEEMTIENQDDIASIKETLDMVDGGYKAIIFPKGDDCCG